MTTPPRTPTTAAGRALVESARQRSSLTWRDTPNHVALVAKTVEQTTTMVLAIEAEARASLDEPDAKMLRKMLPGIDSLLVIDAADAGRVIAGRPDVWVVIAAYLRAAIAAAYAEEADRE